MNTQHHKLLHYVLIILMMLAPLRGVFASQLVSCDMDMTTPVMRTVDGVSAAEHCQHDMDAVMSNVQSIDHSTQQDSQHSSHLAKSCCSDNGACMSDCHSAISISLFIQQADYSPALLQIDVVTNTSSELIVRELSPPSRPPLSLYS